jgi:hypothetical protein
MAEWGVNRLVSVQEAKQKADAMVTDAEEDVDLTVLLQQENGAVAALGYFMPMADPNPDFQVDHPVFEDKCQDAAQRAMDMNYGTNIPDYESGPLECTGWPATTGYKKNDNKERCLLANTQLDDGYMYVYNENRYNEKAECGKGSKCWCCRRKVSG